MQWSEHTLVTGSGLEEFEKGSSGDSLCWSVAPCKSSTVLQKGILW